MERMHEIHCGFWGITITDTLCTGSHLGFVCHAPSVHKRSECWRAQKLAKVKVADKLSFPLALDLAPLLAAEAAPGAAPAEEQQYELAAILIHKGPSASHGHYGARGFP